METYNGTGFMNSGNLSEEPAGPGAPPNDTFSVVFDTPGAYQFVCLVHPFMTGTVEVVDVTDTDVPTQADIDARGQVEMAPLLAFTDDIQGAIASGQVVEPETGPNGSVIWLVQAGVGPPEAEVLDFLTKDLTIQQGDTVVWTTRAFHTVTFSPGPEPPAFIILQFQDQGPPLLTINSQVVLPAKPSAEFDPTQFYNSGLIGAAESPGGTGFSLTFNETGTFKYICAVHSELGIEGSITVVPN